MIEVFPHTADVGLRVQSPDLNTLFAEAGRGLLSLIVSNSDDVELHTSVKFHIEGCDLAYLLVDWLNELLFAFESRRLLLAKFDVSVTPDGLKAEAQGETVDDSRHVLDHEIKAVTYHNLQIIQTDQGLNATVVFDV